MRFIYFLLIFYLTTSCSNSTKQMDEPAGHKQPRWELIEEGLASWYGKRFEGKLTASGEPFSTDSMTAAHKSLPFGTLVRVTNLDNGKQCIVKINDRGPFIENRIIDLSQAAARQIEIIKAGVVPVKIEHKSIPKATDKKITE